MRFLVLAALMWLALPLALANAQGFVGKRLALVVGNSNYQAVYSLQNAVSDSKAVAGALESLGFEVTLLNDGTLAQMNAAIDDMKKRADDGAEATLFYFSGHGFQLGGANYIVPVDAVLDSRDKISERTLRLDDVITRLASRDRQTLILLDACRDNPLPASVRGNDTANGLADIATGLNTYIAFATAPGSVSHDGKGGQGPFARALINNITLPDMSISDMMINVRTSVLTQTHGLQVPWDANSLLTPFYFNPGNAETGVAFGTVENQAPLENFEAGVTLGQAPAVDVAAVAPKPVPAPPAAPEPTPLAPTPAVPASLPRGTAEAVDPGNTAPVAPAKPEVAEPAAVVVADVPPEDLRSVGEPVASTPQPAEPAPAAAPAETNPSSDVASLPQVPTLAPLEPVPQRIIGTDVSPEEQDATTPPVTATPPAPEQTVDVALAVQGQLQRLGCYSGTIDGDWGKGSRTALKHYFDGKNEDSAATEPTQELLAKLTGEQAVICKEESVVATPEPVQQPTTPTKPRPAAAPAKPQVATTRPEPAPGKPKLKLGGGTGTFR